MYKNIEQYVQFKEDCDVDSIIHGGIICLIQV